MQKQIKQKRKHLKKQLQNNLVKKQNVTEYKPTLATAAFWYRKLNGLLFNSRLGGVHIEIKKIHNDWGRCIADWDNRKTPRGRFDQRVIPYHIPVTYKIQLITKYPRWKDFIETLAHEMVHLYQMTVMKDPFSNHNDNFYAFRNKFKAVGLRLYR